MQQYDLIVFDWDGTLIDSTGLIASCLQQACRDLALPVPAPEQARAVIGLGLNEAMAQLLPELPTSEHGHVAERYRAHFFAHDHQPLLFAGVPQLFAALHASGYRLAVATGKSRRGLDRDLELTGMGTWFHASRCADESFSKPHPAMLLELMDSMGANPERTLMVGDTTHDLQMAANAKVGAVAVNHGTQPAESLLALAPLACLSSIAELGKWLKNSI